MGAIMNWVFKHPIDFFDAIEKDDHDTVQHVINNKVSNIAEMIEEETVKLKQEMQGVAESLNA